MDLLRRRPKPPPGQCRPHALRRNFIAGSHDFKFGAEVEHSTALNRFGYTGKDNMHYFDYTGANYLAYQYAGYDTDTRYTRLEFFAQDGWKITDRLNLGIGLRFSQNWGTVKDVEGVVYKSTRVAPRVGLTYDISATNPPF